MLGQTPQPSMFITGLIEPPPPNADTPLGTIRTHTRIIKGYWGDWDLLGLSVCRNSCTGGSYKLYDAPKPGNYSTKDVSRGWLTLIRCQTQKENIALFYWGPYPCFEYLPLPPPPSPSTNPVSTKLSNVAARADYLRFGGSGQSIKRRSFLHNLHNPWITLAYMSVHCSCDSPLLWRP